MKKKGKQIAEMEEIRLRKAIIEDKSVAVKLDYQLNKIEQTELKREEKITKAISNDVCFLILATVQEVGFVIFDYRFFDQEWIELIVIKEEYKGKGISVKMFDLISQKCNTDKIFTATNRSNTRKQRGLAKSDFSFAGELNGFDDGDPERFYYRTLNQDKKTMSKQKIIKIKTAYNNGQK